MQEWEGLFMFDPSIEIMKRERTLKRPACRAARHHPQNVKKIIPNLPEPQGVRPSKEPCRQVQSSALAGLEPSPTN
jgi:hypothetical protein